jgi:hypothetical protein
MQKPDTSWMPDKLSPEFQKRYPNAITGKAFLEALYKGWLAEQETSQQQASTSGESSAASDSPQQPSSLFRRQP